MGLFLLHIRLPLSCRILRVSMQDILHCASFSVWRSLQRLLLRPSSHVYLLLSLCPRRIFASMFFGTVTRSRLRRPSFMHFYASPVLQCFWPLLFQCTCTLEILWLLKCTSTFWRFTCSPATITLHSSLKFQVGDGVVVTGGGAGHFPQ
jgi:hypothetical protein